MRKEINVTAAKKLLDEVGVSPEAIKPIELSKAANQLNKSLRITLNLIAFLKTGGQAYSPFPQTAKVLTGEYS